MKTYTDLDLPTSLVVDGGIKVGKTICIHGSANGDRFDINLQNSHHSYDDWTRAISLHISVRFDQNVVVRNTYRNNAWETEERHGGMPLALNEHFSLAIKINEYNYAIQVNGEDFVEFEHRLDKELGCVLGITGNANISKVYFSSGDDSMVPNDPIYNPGNQSSNYIGSLVPGRVIIVSGDSNGADRATIEFKNEDKIAFHFDIRFTYGEGNVVVRNSWDENGWANEEREGGFPFIQGKNFNVVFRIKQDRFTVSVDGKHFTDFVHRFEPVEMFDTVALSGSANFFKIDL